ncbi:ammonium permease mep3 [Emydomyces testavorans]|uniref:Neutral protease 2 n=1 Tax=Emydomyces testavorans TaxID=2070801 RepID=A0AAF0DMP7_9EURO|nr:ammonium permease mep3 [Emydomyces testavorans]
MFFCSAVLALAALTCQALAFPVDNLPEHDSGLKVELTAVGNTRVKAVVTNKGDREMSFLKFNSFFDPAAVQKVQVAKDGSPVPFNGMFRFYDMSDLPEDAFKTLAPGASAETTFDIAETSDLSAGGSYTISSNGVIPFVEGNGTAPTGAMMYSANELKLEVDGKMAASVAQSIPELEKRTRIDQRCPQNYRGILERGLQTAAGYANRASQAASQGTKFQEFFKTMDNRARQSASARYRAIAGECGSTSNGRTTYYCDDRFNGCQQGVIAYTIPARSVVVSCPAYWRLPARVNQGLAPDHGYVIVHEFTHATSIYSPGTQDHAYGYENCRRLNSQQSLSNADNYSLYAACKFYLSSLFLIIKILTYMQLSREVVDKGILIPARGKGEKIGLGD